MLPHEETSPPASANGQDAAASTNANLLSTMEAVNLDEVVTSTLRVAIREAREVTATDASGVERKHKEYYTRIAQIESYVPMSVFNRMLATRSKVMRERRDFLEHPRDDYEDPLMQWMTEQVLAVWKLSEEDMTLERLSLGLDFPKVSRLFALFFGHLLQTPVR